MRRRIKFALVILAVAATPFCWSVGRDLFHLLLADGKEAQAAEAAIALQLVAWHKRLHVGEAPPLSSASMPANCYSVPKGSVRIRYRLPNNKIDGTDEDFRSSSDMVTMNGYGIPYAFFSEQLALETLQKNLSPLGLATLNACMTATPFSRRCDASIKENMGFDHNQVERRLVTYGFMRHAIAKSSARRSPRLRIVRSGSGQTRP